MTHPSLIALACALTAAAGAHAADQLQAPMTLVSADGTGKMIGSVTVSESPGGLVFSPNLTSLPPGAHGFIFDGSSRRLFGAARCRERGRS